MQEDTQAQSEEGLKRLLQPELFRSLADPTRLQVLFRLACASAPQTVTEISGCCGVHLSGVSRHLAALRDAGVVHAQRRGREVLYSLNRTRLTSALRDLADAVDRCALGACDEGTAQSDACCD